MQPGITSLLQEEGGNTFKGLAATNALVKSRQRRYPGHNDRVQSVLFSPDGQLLASASTEGTVRFVGEVASGKALQTFKESSDKINSVAFSPDGQILAGASDDWLV